jgi:hypothetical protein
MKKGVLEIYALAVCFVAVVCLVCALGVGIYCFIASVSPSFTLSAWEYEQYQTNDAYWQMRTRGRGGETVEGGKPEMERPTDYDLTRMRERDYALALRSEQRSGGQGVVKSAIVIVIDLVVFYIHWLIARRARATAPA